MRRAKKTIRLKKKSYRPSLELLEDRLLLARFFGVNADDERVTVNAEFQPDGRRIVDSIVFVDSTLDGDITLDPPLTKQTFRTRSGDTFPVGEGGFRTGRFDAPSTSFDQAEFSGSFSAQDTIDLDATLFLRRKAFFEPEPVLLAEYPETVTLQAFQDLDIVILGPNGELIGDDVKQQNLPSGVQEVEVILDRPSGVGTSRHTFQLRLQNTPEIPQKILDVIGPGVGTVRKETIIDSQLLEGWRVEGDTGFRRPFDGLPGLPIVVGEEHSLSFTVIAAANAAEDSKAIIDIAVRPTLEETLDAGKTPFDVVRLIAKFETDEPDGDLQIKAAHELEGDFISDVKQSTPSVTQTKQLVLPAEVPAKFDVKVRVPSGKDPLFLRAAETSSDAGLFEDVVYREKSTGRVVTDAIKAGTLTTDQLTLQDDIAIIEVEIKGKAFSPESSTLSSVLELGEIQKDPTPIDSVKAELVLGLVVNSVADQADPDENDGVPDVDRNMPGLQTTLRSVITFVNSLTLSRAPRVIFNFPAAGTQTIRISSFIKPNTNIPGLPAIEKPIILDASTHGNPVVLDGASAGENGNGFRIDRANDVTIKGFTISNFDRNGIEVFASKDVKIIGNQIGTDATGQTLQSNGGDGVRVTHSQNVHIGGAGSDGNVISGNLGDDISLEKNSGTLIAGNILGLARDGTTPLQSAVTGQTGVFASNETNLTIGQSNAANLISAYFSSGIHLRESTALVENNLVGTDSSGTQGRGNTTGISSVRGNVTIRGNVISDNQDGIVIQDGNTVIQGNIIGRSKDGTQQLGNTRHGVNVFFFSGDITIGGDSSKGEGNVVSSSGSDAIRVANGFKTGSQLKIQGNAIGDPGVTGKFNNTGNGIHILNVREGEIQIGGTGGLGNQIIANELNGITIGDPESEIPLSIRNIKIRGNVIRFNQNGLQAVAAKNIVIGGTGNGEGNSIEFNEKAGILLLKSKAPNDEMEDVTISGNRIADGNDIGIDIAGPTFGQFGAIRGLQITANDIENNDLFGIRGFPEKLEVLIGGPDTAQGNIIKNNGVGLHFFNGTPSTVGILSNSIHSNSGLGINFGDAQRVTPDVNGDGLQDFPTLTAASSNTAETFVLGQLLGVASSRYFVQYFANSVADPSGHGEGETLLGSRTYTIGSDGNPVPIVERFATPTPGGHFITATSTKVVNPNQSGESFTETSEFSAAIEVESDVDSDRDGVSDQLESAVQDGSELDPDVAAMPLFNDDNQRIDAVLRGNQLEQVDGTAEPSEKTKAQLPEISLFGPVIEFIVAAVQDGTALVETTLENTREFTTPAFLKLDEDGNPRRDENGRPILFTFDEDDDVGAKIDSIDNSPDGVVTQRIDARFSYQDGSDGDEDGIVNGTIRDRLMLVEVADTVLEPGVIIYDVSVKEGAGSVVFTLRLTFPIQSGVTVGFEAKSISDSNLFLATRIGGDLADENDFTPVTTTATFFPGSTVTTVEVAITDDPFLEGTEHFMAELSNPVGASLLDTSALTRILDNDRQPFVITPPDFYVNEGESRAFSIQTHTSNAQAPVDAELVVDDGTAQQGTDFELKSEAVQFASGQTELDVLLTTTNNDRQGVPIEDAVVYFVPKGRGAGRLQSFPLGIINNDGPATFSIRDSTATEGGAISQTVVLSGSSTQGASVVVSTQDGSATAGADYDPSGNSTLNFNPPPGVLTRQTPTIDDNDREAFETFTSSLSNPAGASISDGSAVHTIFDDDAAAGDLFNDGFDSSDSSSWSSLGARLQQFNNDTIPNEQLAATDLTGDGRIDRRDAAEVVRRLTFNRFDAAVAASGRATASFVETVSREATNVPAFVALLPLLSAMARPPAGVQPAALDAALAQMAGAMTPPADDLNLALALASHPQSADLAEKTAALEQLQQEQEGDWQRRDEAGNLTGRIAALLARSRWGLFALVALLMLPSSSRAAPGDVFFSIDDFTVEREADATEPIAASFDVAVNIEGQSSVPARGWLATLEIVPAEGTFGLLEFDPPPLVFDPNLPPAKENAFTDFDRDTGGMAFGQFGPTVLDLAVLGTYFDPLQGLAPPLDANGNLTLPNGSGLVSVPILISPDAVGEFEVVFNPNLDFTGVSFLTGNPEPNATAVHAAGTHQGATLTIEVIAAELMPGDFSGDNVVDIQDYNLWSASFGSMTDLAADANGDGIVGAADYVVWRNAVAATASSGRSLSVPEPSAVLLLLTGAGLFVRCWRRNSNANSHD